MAINALAATEHPIPPNIARGEQHAGNMDPTTGNFLSRAAYGPISSGPITPTAPAAPNALAAPPPAPVDPYAGAYAQAIAAARAGIAQTLTASLAGIQAHQNAANSMIGEFPGQMNALTAETTKGLQSDYGQTQGQMGYGMHFAGEGAPAAADNKAAVAGVNLAGKFAAGAAPLMTAAESMQSNALRSQAQQAAGTARSDLAAREAGYAHDSEMSYQSRQHDEQMARESRAFQREQGDVNFERTLELKRFDANPANDPKAAAALRGFGDNDTTVEHGKAIATYDPTAAAQLRSSPNYQQVVQRLREFGQAGPMVAGTQMPSKLEMMQADPKWIDGFLRGDPAYGGVVIGGSQTASTNRSVLGIKSPFGANKGYTQTLTTQPMSPEAFALALFDAGA